ncbi:hypothetical protein ABEB36_011786 [Hypothenemus hampei]|uniref:Protein brambleberry n=1 Tax=Hypothenemus hampei TaxID=57062 RepID=A0ABD1E965_HYPHA
MCFKVVLKLRSDCNKMNDEQLAKMAVHLLNCQSYVEGRKIYPCSEEMTIKQCTSAMDSDTWTSYHLMSNRARAVCYMVRQTQFRGMAEHTVNRLMEASKDQLRSLNQITLNQENILELSENTYESLSKAQNQLSEQQQDMRQAQLYGQLVLENNIMRLADEKRLIHETHSKLLQMTQEVQHKLESSAQMIVHQTSENKLNHKELLEDINRIQEKANDLFAKIDVYSEILLQQNEDFKIQYESTIRNLKEVNNTVHNLVNLVGGTKKALEERLSWITDVLGGTDKAVERLYLVSWHLGFILISMLSSVFLSALPSTRLATVTLPILNLVFAIYGNASLDFSSLIMCLMLILSGQHITIWALRFRGRDKPAIQATPTKSSSSVDDAKLYKERELEEETDTFQSLTPPLSRNGHYLLSRSRSNTPLRLNTSLKAACRATTRAGTPCKLTSLPGRDYCYRHQSGDSIMG